MVKLPDSSLVGSQMSMNFMVQKRTEISSMRSVKNERDLKSTASIAREDG